MKVYFILRNTKTGEYVGDVHNSDEGTRLSKAKRFRREADAHEYVRKYMLGDKDVITIKIAETV